MFFVSMALTLAAMVLVAVFGLRFGIDFRGGSAMELVFEKSRPALEDLQKVVSSVNGVSNISISPVADNGMLIRLNAVDETTHQQILKAVSDKFDKVTESSFNSIGPTIGKELRSKSITSPVSPYLI